MLPALVPALLLLAAPETHALEGAVGDRVILDVHREALVVRVEGQPLELVAP